MNIRRTQWTGGRIRQVRKEQGMLLRDLAEKAGVSKQSLARYETGQREPRADVFWRIAVALDVQDLDWLAGWERKT